MAHPKLSTVFNRSLLAASTAALIAGPLAAIGTAQSLETVTETTDDVVDLTCDEAKETEDLELIEEFCDDEELAKAKEEARQELEKEAKNTTDTVEKTTGVKAPVDPTGGGGGDDGDDGGSDPEPAPAGGVLPSDNSNEKPKAQSGSREVRNQGEQPRGISAGGPGGSSDGNPARGGYGGPVYSGMQTNSALTLQPFAAPLVSVPPVYELPQVAQELFGLGSATATDGTAVAMADGTSTTASAYSPTGYSATPADASGWLAATATGLIMLLGAAHALNGARTPKRKRA